MAIVCEKFIFFHTPKTGGSWVRRAIGNSTEVILELLKHPLPRMIKHKPIFTFAFVRHPLTWYRSYWAYKNRVGWRPEPGMDDLRSDTFDGFLNNVLNHGSGYLSLMFDRRLGHHIGFVGKYENLVEDLVYAMKKSGQQFDEKALRETPPENVSPEYPKYNMDLAKKILKAEEAVLKRFNYSDDIEEVLNGK